MDEQKRNGIRTLAEAFEQLPDDKKEILLAYGEGMAAALAPRRENTQTTAEKTSA